MAKENSSLRIGWFMIEEDFLPSGDIDVAIRDPRTGEMLAFTLAGLEHHQALMDYLSENRQIGTLKRLKESKAS
jgi:hypothetical protein